MTNGTASETNGITRGTNGDGLLRCPHCGSVAEYVSEHAKGRKWAVACTMTSKVAAGEGRPMCRCRTPFVRDKGQARDIWNRRDFSMAVHDGRTWVCVEGALESDVLKPIEGFTRDSIYRDSMREYGEWMEKATELMRDMWPLVLADGASEAFAERLREFGIEVG